MDVQNFAGQSTCAIPLGGNITVGDNSSMWIVPFVFSHNGTVVYDGNYTRIFSAPVIRRCRINDAVLTSHDAVAATLSVLIVRADGTPVSQFNLTKSTTPGNITRWTTTAFSPDCTLEIGDMLEVSSNSGADVDFALTVTTIPLDPL